MSTRFIISCYVIMISLEFSHPQSLFREEDFRCEERRDIKIAEKLRLYENKIKVLENQISRIEANNLEDPVRLMGMEFYMVFPPLFADDGRSYCVLYIVSISSGSCTVALPLLTKRYILKLKQGENQLFLPSSYMALENQVEKKGVHIECDVFVNVYAAKHDKFTTTVFLVLPIHSRFHYKYRYIPSIQPNPVSVKYAHLYNSTLSIVSSGDNNIVKIQLNLTEGESIHIGNQGYAYNDSIQLIMNKYESLVISHGVDLTGSTISSIDPIFVATGNKCARLHHDNACSGMNFMIPLDNSHLDIHYDSEHVFVTPFFYPFLRGYKIRILSMKNDYRLQYIMGQENKTETLFVQNNYVDIDVDSNIPVYIRTSRFVSVTVITPGKNNTDGIGTAFMLYIPDERSLLSEYHFVVPDLNTTSYITVISRNVSNIRLDENIVDVNRTVIYDINAKPYDVIALPVQPGYHVARNILKESFSLYVYGKQKPNLGYGFPAGFYLNIKP
ncbi:uncharacterized protein LOC133196653 [Saccostrea echinata]|uniref:uncharacterized protein LOC133196653 n=1 Tax=Saccostrea echinata TaxID=191078 RepID=UPI002A7F5A2D|nr:uncharacterized protein LOC133196653 [Saccostrea echinata]